MDIIRAWKDADYRNSLSEAERAALPAHPAGDLVALTDADLGLAVGGLGGAEPSCIRPYTQPSVYGAEV